MALVTLCPGCGATYKIYPVQLQAQNGLVRCGQCQAIFNGFSTLITIDESEIEYLPVLAENSNASDVCQEMVAVTGGKTTPDSGTRIESVTLMPSSAPDNQGVHNDETGVAVSSEPAEVGSSNESSDFLSDVKFEKPHVQRLWLAGSFVLLIVLFGQAIYAYRAELVVQLPQSRSVLERFCDILSCELPLQENIQLLSIVSSDLQVKDPENWPEVAELTAIIRNHAPYMQALPALKLFLTDKHNAVIASRIITAEEYLSEMDVVKMAIQPDQEISVQLYLDNSQLKPTGYRLQILYP